MGQGGRERAQGGERPMGTSAYGRKGCKGRAAVILERRIGAASCTQQHHQVSCQNPTASPSPSVAPMSFAGGGRHPIEPDAGPGHAGERGL